MLFHRRLNLQSLDDLQILHTAYNWKSQMPGWYQAMAAMCPLTWQEFLEERKQSTYANFAIVNEFGLPVSLIAFSALGNDDYETHLISKRGVSAAALYDVMATLRDAMFSAMNARLLVAKVADCNAGMRRLLRQLGFVPTMSVSETGMYRQHRIRVRLWRLGRSSYGSDSR